MTTPLAVSGIVLAGGRSSRFRSGVSGGRGSPDASKLDADLGGVTVLDRTIDALAGVVGEIVVVGRPSARSGARSGERSGARFIEDDEPFSGPLAGLARGLDVATGALALAVGGDMPLLRPGVLGLLLARLARDPNLEAVTLEEGGVARPLPVALRRDAARDAARASLEAGSRSLRDLLSALRLGAVAEAKWRAIDPAGDTLLDVDAPADLDRARARLAGH